MITGKGRVIAHIGYPTESFKAPMIYNPWFEAQGHDAIVVPLGVRSEDFVRMFPDLFRITTMHGALITMPHKITVLQLVDEVTPTAQIAGAANAVLKRPDGSLARRHVRRRRLRPWRRAQGPGDRRYSRAGGRRRRGRFSHRSLPRRGRPIAHDAL